MIRNRVDPFTTPLDRLNYEAVYDALRDFGTETQRLEFKQQPEPEALARAAAAMANGTGGLIIVGFKDPKPGVPLTRHGFVGAEDEAARRRLLSRIQARVYPSLPLDAATYTAADGTHHFLALRVDASAAAPHEVLSDRGRFVIRRGTEVTGMTLRELEAMILRRDAAPTALDGANDVVRDYPMISLDRAVPEGFVGIRLYPETRTREEPLSRSRQREIERVVQRLTGLNAASGQTYPQGILFMTEPPPPQATVVDEARLERWRRRAYVGADGHFEIRDTEVGESYQTMLLTVLCNAYTLGSQLFSLVGIGPRARGTLVCHRRTAQESNRPIAGDGEFSLDVDFASDSVMDMARRPLMYALRSAGTLTEPTDLDAEIAEFWRFQHSGIVGSDLRERWD